MPPLKSREGTFVQCGVRPMTNSPPPPSYARARRVPAHWLLIQISCRRPGY